jgi:outer membrane protein, heavy metal efflux system
MDRNRARPATWALALALLAPGAALAAGSPSPAPPVQDLVREALDRSPTLAARQARVEAARQMVGPAGALADPMVEVMIQDVGAPWDPMRAMSMGQVSYTQALPWPGKRAARRDAVAAEADMAAALADDVRRTLVMQVRQAYGRLYLLDREGESLSAAREMLSLLSSVASARYAAGQGDQEALVKAQLEASRLEERRSDLEAARAASVAVLNRLLDRPAGTGLGPVATLPGAEASPGDLSDRALAVSPEVSMRRAALQAADRRLDAARLESRPNFLVGVGAGTTLAPEAVVTLRLGIELPIWNRRKADPMVAQARADLAAATEELRESEARVRSEADRLSAQWRRDQEQVVRYREAIVPQSAVAMDAARASYLAGRGDFGTVIEDFRMWLDARVMQAGREADRFMTWAEMEMLAAPAADAQTAGGVR